MGEDAVQVANFTIGSCTQGPGGFTAIAEDGAWRPRGRDLQLHRLWRLHGPLRRARPAGRHRGAAGTFSNETWQPGGLPFSGAIHFNDGDRHHMGVGLIEFRTADQSAAISGAGGMTCVYPDDE